MKKTINIGILHSLTGTMSFSESPLVDATLMAVDEINQSGGVKGAAVVPMVEDCRSDPDVYAMKTKRLVSRESIAHFFGCWTSASRKAVKPVVEESNALLWYPVQYEGLEQSPNIVYTGNCLNQQIEPAFHWSAEHLGGTCYLVGSDYVYPRTANTLIRTLCRRYGVRVLGESYLPLGAENFERIVDDIKRLKPGVVFNTINGDSNLAFYYSLHRTGNQPEQIPVMAFSIGEVELRDIGLSAVGHYACCSYFQCLGTNENQAFIKRFQDRYGAARVVSDAVVSAYNQPFLWKQLVEKCGTFDVSVVRNNIAGTCHQGPSGRIEIHANHHAAKAALIGKVNTDLQFDIVWQHATWIPPLPWLGLEGVDLAAAEMIREALAAYPEKLVFQDRLKQAVDRRLQVEADLKREQTRLQESRQRYDALLHAIRDGVVVANAKTGRINDCNKIFEHQSGRKRATLRGQHVWDLVPPARRDATRKRFFRFKTPGSDNRGRVDLCRPDGASVTLNYESKVVKIGGVAMVQTILAGSEDSS